MQINAIKYAVGSFTGKEYVDVIVSGMPEPIGLGKITDELVKYERGNISDASTHTVVITAPDGGIFYLDPSSIIGFVRVPVAVVEQE